MLAGFLLVAAGALCLAGGVLLGPRYRSERSAYLATLSIRPLSPGPAGGGTATPSAASAPAVPRGRRRWHGLLAAYAGLAVALPGLVHGRPGWAGPLLAALVGGCCLPWVWSQVAEHRRRAAMEQAVGDLIGHLRLQASIGITLLPALGSAPPVVREPLRQHLLQLLADAQLSPLPLALERFAGQTGSPRVQALVRHLLHQHSLGIPLQQVLSEEEQHYLTMAREEARQRIRSATMTMAVVTFVLFMNGALIFATPLAVQAFRFLTE